MTPALAAPTFEFDGAAGRLVCYVAGQGPPLLLVHSINATGSAAEVEPLFDDLQNSRTVFAIDLPGYGLSERSDRAYTPRLMTDALHATAAQIRQRSGFAATQPIDAMALSLSCEFLARAAVEQPQHWGRLALVSPTGFNGLSTRRAAPGTTRGLPMLHRVLSQPLWAQALFNGLTKPSVVRYFLRRTYGRQDIDETLWAKAVEAARAPGARHAPLHFLAANLFSADIHSVYDAITQPVWMSHGVRGDFTDYRGAAMVEHKSNWRITVFQTGAMPYFEVREAFVAALRRYLA